jgi:glutamate carboxypeptidase
MTLPEIASIAVDPVPLRDWIADRRDEMVADLRAYVEHETPSDDKAMLDKGLVWLREWITDRLGPPDTHETFDGGDFGDTDVLHYGGTGDPLTLLCHYDTVWPLGTLADFPFSIEGDVIRGPGVFDMKAGLVQAVWALRALRDCGVPTPPIRLLLNGDEELGSPASRAVIEDTCAGSKAVLVFESSAEGQLKSARKGVGIFDVAVYGLAAHAGLEPAKGASAIDEIARVVGKLHALTDLDTGTTVNVGLLSGGSRRNVVAALASAGIDVRVASENEARRIDWELAALTPVDSRVTINVSGEWNRPVMERSPGVARLVEIAQHVATQMGTQVGETAVGGASDGNFAAGLGLPVLDGLGAVGAGAHARDEHTRVSGMLERSAVAAGVLAALA